MERLCSLAMGVAFLGRAYHHLPAFILSDHHRNPCLLNPCDVFSGFRTRARALLAGQWERGPTGFVRRADPLHPGPYTFFGWQASAVPGGACGGLLFPDGLGGHLRFKARLRRTQALLEEVPLVFYIRTGVPAACGALGTRLVPHKLWCPVAPEQLHITRTVSSDARFLNVDVRWL